MARTVPLVGEPPKVASSSVEAFELLRRAGAGQRLRMRETGVEVAAGLVANAIDAAGDLLLLVPIDEDEPEVDDDASRGVTLRTRILIDKERERRFLVLRCELPALATTFASLCDDLLAALAREPEHPAATTVRVLDRWRDLLGPASPRLLSEQAVLGLLVELRLLEALADEIGVDSAMRAWSGPSRGRQDFMRPNAAIEAKGSSGRDRVLIEIHGLRQLEEPEGGQLYLWVEHMERVSEGGDCLPGAIDRLQALGISRFRILHAIEPLGYRPADEDAYRAVRFRPLKRRVYTVTGAFPRLVPLGLTDPGLADRISAVRYTLDLTDPDSVPGLLDDPALALRALADGATP